MVAYQKKKKKNARGNTKEAQVAKAETFEQPSKWW